MWLKMYANRLVRLMVIYVFKVHMLCLVKYKFEKKKKKKKSNGTYAVAQCLRDSKMFLCPLFWCGCGERRHRNEFVQRGCFFFSFKSVQVFLDSKKNVLRVHPPLRRQVPVLDLSDSESADLVMDGTVTGHIQPHPLSTSLLQTALADLSEIPDNRRLQQQKRMARNFQEPTAGKIAFFPLCSNHQSHKITFFIQSVFNPILGEAFPWKGTVLQS